MSSVVAVVSVGAKTPVGLNARPTGFPLGTGFPAMDEVRLVDAAGGAITMAVVPRLDGRLVGAERVAALAGTVRGGGRPDSRLGGGGRVAND